MFSTAERYAVPWRRRMDPLSLRWSYIQVIAGNEKEEYMKKALQLLAVLQQRRSPFLCQRPRREGGGALYKEAANDDATASF